MAEGQESLVEQVARLRTGAIEALNDASDALEAAHTARKEAQSVLESARRGVKSCEEQVVAACRDAEAVGVSRKDVAAVVDVSSGTIGSWLKTGAL